MRFSSRVDDMRLRCGREGSGRGVRVHGLSPPEGPREGLANEGVRTSRPEIGVRGGGVSRYTRVEVSEIRNLILKGADVFLELGAR